MIKCTINENGEMLYHLPFDQQYDKIIMTKSNRKYYSSAKDAEKIGYRHVYKWKNIEI
jgi:hypothetical protein